MNTLSARMNRLKSQYAESANRSGISFVASKSGGDYSKKGLPPRKKAVSPGLEPQYYGMRAPLRNKGFSTSSTPNKNKSSTSRSRSSSPSRSSQAHSNPAKVTSTPTSQTSLYSTTSEGVYLTSELDFDNIDVTKLSNNEKDRLIINMMKEIDRLKNKVNNIVDDAELSLQQAIDSQETLSQEYQSKIFKEQQRAAHIDAENKMLKEVVRGLKDELKNEKGQVDKAMRFCDRVKRLNETVSDRVIFKRHLGEF